MKTTKPKKGNQDNQIAGNKRAGFEYSFEDRYEAGLVLLGWEVKSLRAKKGQISESHVIIKRGEAWLIGAHIAPLSHVGPFLHADPTRTRKLLLNRKELNKLIGAVERKGYTIVPTVMYWKNGMAKIQIALAKGKQTHDKRASIKERDWKIEKQRLQKYGR